MSNVSGAEVKSQEEEIGVLFNTEEVWAEPAAKIQASYDSFKTSILAGVRACSTCATFSPAPKFTYTYKAHVSFFYGGICGIHTLSQHNGSLMNFQRLF